MDINIIIVILVIIFDANGPWEFLFVLWSAEQKTKKKGEPTVKLLQQKLKSVKCMKLR